MALTGPGLDGVSIDIVANPTAAVAGLRQVEAQAKRTGQAGADVGDGFDKAGRQITSRLLGGAAAAGAMLTAVERLYAGVQAFNNAGAQMVRELDAISKAILQPSAGGNDAHGQRVRQINEAHKAQMDALQKEREERNLIAAIVDKATGEGTYRAKRQAIENARAAALRQAEADKEREDEKRRADQRRDDMKRDRALGDQIRADAAKEDADDAAKRADREKHTAEDRKQLAREAATEAERIEIDAQARLERIREQERESPSELPDLIKALQDANAIADKEREEYHKREMDRIKEEGDAQVREIERMRDEFKQMRDEQQRGFGLGDIDFSNVTAGTALQVIARELPRLRQGGY